MNKTQLKSLSLIAAGIGYNVKVVDTIDAGNSIGDCDYMDSQVRVARRILSRGKLVWTPPHELLFALAHELSHAIREHTTDDPKLADHSAVLYAPKLYTRMDISQKRKLSALSYIYRDELETDWAAADLLQKLGYWTPKMITCIQDTHMLMHRYNLHILYGAYSSAKLSRIKGLQFEDLTKAKLDKKVLARMTAFMLLYPQYNVGEPVWES
jgi:hypothetical protein